MTKTKTFLISSIVLFSFLLLAISCNKDDNDKIDFLTFNHDGLVRQYIYYSPSNLPEEAPLVFVMHGYTRDADTIRDYSGMNNIADQYGFAVCYPRGTIDWLGDRFFNVGYDFHGDETVNDIDFLIKLAQHLQTTHNLSPEKTFATGLSNGADMCYLLACVASSTFKGIAPVAGIMLQTIFNNYNPINPIPVFEIHGTEDEYSFFNGDPNNTEVWGAYPSIPFTIDYWAQKNGCTSLQIDTLPNSNTTDGSFVISEKHLNGVNGNEVWLYKVVGGGHDWPGSFGNMDINASEEIWQFFSKFF
ncbi:alpha/beta hydrolase family esterase [Bacteroidota bacterium]